MSVTHLKALNREQIFLAPKDAKNHLRHNCVTRLNLYKFDDGVEFREFPLKCGYPQPIYMEEEDYASGFNHPQVLVRQKHNFKERLAQLKRRIMGKQEKEKLKAKLGKDAYGGNFPLFLELLKQDPDKYFDGPYDWYYTGGSLTLTNQINSKEFFLLSATGKYLDKLRVSQHSKARTKIIDLSSTSAGIIYETYQYKDYYMVRQKNSVTGFSHDGTEDVLGLVEKFAIGSKFPLLSSAFTSADSKIATIDVNQIIKLWDPEKKSSGQSNKFDIKRKIDNWGYLKTFNESLMLYSNRSEFNVLDFRVPDYKTIGTYAYENDYECNKIYGMANSKFDNLVYISANHALYGLDIRRLPEKLSMNTLIKWTHLMQLPPIMIDTVLYNGDEYIYLSSSLKNNQKICVNKKNTVYSSPYLPYKPKSIGDTYHQLRLQGNCLDPLSDFGDRINVCTTGIGIFVNNNILHTILSNANGDIFYQKFEDNDHGVPTDTISNMEQWVNYLKTNKCSKITNMDKLDSILLAMQCKKLSLPTGIEEGEEQYPRPNLKWQRSITQLYMYKDVLAKNILDVWDFKVPTNGELTNSQLESQLDSTELTYSSKIDEWFTRIHHIEPLLCDNADIEDDDGNITNPSQIVLDTFETMDTSQSFKTKRNIPVRKSGRLAGF